jgi:hypothetical protein
MQDVRSVLVQIRIARRERARWAAVAAAADMRLGELIRESVRARVLELERHRFLATGASLPVDPGQRVSG